MIVFHVTSIWQLERTEAWLQKKQRQGLTLKRMVGPFYQFVSGTNEERQMHYWMEFHLTGSQGGTASLFLEHFRADSVTTIFSSYSVFRYLSDAKRDEDLVQPRKDRYRHARTAMIQRFVLTIIVAVLLVVRFQNFVMSPLGIFCMFLLLLYILYNIVGLAFVQQRIA